MSGTSPHNKSKGDHLPGKLAAVALKRLPDGSHSDGGNLYLLVRGASRSWVFRYTSPLDGKRRNMGLGGLDSVSLARARELARENRSLVKDRLDPVDPLAAAEARKTARAKAARVGKTFEECAEIYIDLHRVAWENAKHVRQWQNTLSKYVYPQIGDMPVSDVDTADVIACLEPIWTEKTETAKRVQGRVERILDWAIASGYRQGANPAQWRGHLNKLLPAPSKVSKVKHYPALPYEDAGHFLSQLSKMVGIAPRALEFTILTAARSGEVRGAIWDEIDLDRKLWTVPAARMKARRMHEVPLSSAAILLLQALPRMDTSYVFPGARIGRPISDMSMSKVIRRMGDDVSTVHGFRSTFRDWAAETTAYTREVVEMALAHSVADKTEAAYRRGNLLSKRTLLMQEWADYCAAETATRLGNVLPMRESR